MLKLRKRVLIADSSRKRFAVLKEILHNEFVISAERAKTYDALLAKVLNAYEKFTRKGKESPWQLVLIADDLPSSLTERSVVLKGYFFGIHPLLLNVRLGCLISKPVSSQLREVSPQPSIICFPSLRLTEKLREQIISDLVSAGLRRAPRPPSVILDNDPQLREEIRLLSEHRSLKDGQSEIGYLLRAFVPWDAANVVRLGQGQSGARVFRISNGREGAKGRKARSDAATEYVLKVSPAEDLWKVKLEIKKHALVKRNLGIRGYKLHVALLKKARFQSGSLRNVATTSRFYATCYDYLGEKPFGQFLDLETALVAAPSQLREKTSGTAFAIASRDDSEVNKARLNVLEVMLDWLCTNWYMKPGRVKRQPRRLWDVRDSPEREYPPLPPYRLAGRTKGFILNFLDSEAAKIGVRLFKKGWDAHRQRVLQLLECSEGQETGVRGLDRTLSVVLTPAHGDLNANNILLWLEQSGHPFLIDFPFYQESGHALQDFARLEIDMKFAIMDRQGGSPPDKLPAFDHTYYQVYLWREMEDRLLSGGWRAGKRKWHAGSFPTNVELCLRAVQLLRLKAQEVQLKSLRRRSAPEFLDEYLPALLFHTLRAIGYPSLSIFKRLLAVHSAGCLLESLESRG